MKTESLVPDPVIAFLAPRKLAMVGVSRDSKKFGYITFNDLRSKGFDICLVHPVAKDIDGVVCYQSIDQIPEGFDRLLIMVPPAETNQLIEQAAVRGIRQIWVQQFSDSADTRTLAARLGVTLIDKRCIHMYAEPVRGFHKFHRGLWRLIGKY